MKIMEMQQKMEQTIEEHLGNLEQKIDEFRSFVDEKAVSLRNELVVLKRLYKEGKTNVKNGPDIK